MRLGRTPIADFAGHAGRQDGRGWFARVVRAVVEQRARTGRADWESLYPAMSADERARSHVARVAKKAARSGAVFATCAQTTELLLAATEGLAAPLALPALLGYAAAGAMALALAQVRLVCDIAEIYGVELDAAAIGRILAAALGEPAAAVEDVLLDELGRTIAKEALVGSVPVLGVALSVCGNYRSTKRVGDAAVRALRGALPLNRHSRVRSPGWPDGDAGARASCATTRRIAGGTIAA